MLILISMSRSRQNHTKNKTCDHLIKFGNEFYDKQMLFHGYGKSYSMVMHEKTGDLYFSHVSRSDDFDNREIMACHIKEETCRSVEGISGGFAVAYEKETDELFFGGNDGVYQYDFSEKVAKRIGVNGKMIYGVAIAGKYFFFIVYPKKALYIVKDRDFKHPLKFLDAEVENILLTKSLNVYLSNMTALYKIEPPHRPTKKLIVIDDQFHVRQLVKKINGSVYMCTFEGIYETNETSRKAVKVCDLDKPFGMAFYESMILYSDEHAIHSLVLSNDYECINKSLADMDILRSRFSVMLEL
ncbi:unnamed protein product [Arctia plantaginis]|uniref:Uncharacterized protein n=1 Tax=Arctia plantaginis TaxID=874455 RepID=A0A8S1A5P8_ARCPL|nr:unnamed protein product [Arctia plantaginis]